MSPPLPLQRLHSLALEEVINHMGMMEILYLTQTSRKSRNLIRRCIKQIKLHLKIYHDEKKSYLEFQQIGSSEKSALWIHIPRHSFLNNESSLTSKTYWNLGQAFKIPVFIINGCTWTYWNDELQAFKTIVDFFVDNFKIQQISFDLIRPEPKLAREVMAHAKTLDIKFGKVKVIANETMKTAVCEWILKSCANASELIFDAAYGVTLAPEVFQTFSMNRLYIEHGRRMTVRHICAMTGIRHLSLFYSSLSGQDLNFILKYWVRGTLNFQTMHLPIQTSHRMVMEGLEPEFLGENWYRLQKFDGVTAIVLVNKSNVYLEVE